MSLPRRLAALSVVALVAGLTGARGAAPAWAHTALAGTTPAAGATVTEPVDAVRLTFTEPVSPGLAQVVVSGPDGAEVTSGEAQVAEQVVTQPLQALPVAGSYRVAYRVVAADGHPITGQLQFVADQAATAAAVPPAPAPPVADDAAAVAAPSPPPAQEPRDPVARSARTDGDSGWPVPLVVAVAVAAGAALLVGALQVRRATRRQSR